MPCRSAAPLIIKPHVGTLLRACQERLGTLGSELRGTKGVWLGMRVFAVAPAASRKRRGSRAARRRLPKLPRDRLASTPCSMACRGSNAAIPTPPPCDAASPAAVPCRPRRRRATTRTASAATATRRYRSRPLVRLLPRRQRLPWRSLGLVCSGRPSLRLPPHPRPRPHCPRPSRAATFTKATPAAAVPRPFSAAAASKFPFRLPRPWPRRRSLPSSARAATSTATSRAAAPCRHVPAGMTAVVASRATASTEPHDLRGRLAASFAATALAHPPLPPSPRPRPPRPSLRFAAAGSRSPPSD